MNKPDKNSIRSKLALLKLAEQLSSVTRACELMGYSRDSYYRFKRQYESGGEFALANIDKRKPVIKNRVSSEVEKQVLEIALDYPNYGQAKVSRLLSARGTDISPSGVRSVWVRHNVETKAKRLKALQAMVAQEQRELSEEQQLAVAQLHQLKNDQLELEVEYPGHLGVQDTLELGEVPGFGKVYQQTWIDAYCRYALCKLYTEKTAENACDMLENQVLPKMGKRSLSLKRLLTDRGTEFTQDDRQLFQNKLRQLDIQHIMMRAYNGPEVNGICARFHKIVQDEFYFPLFRKQKCSSLDELQQLLDEWLRYYNEERPQPERYCFGNSPLQTLENSLHLAPQKDS